ncbi:hypothetical protein QFC21_004321 [Naganishia friedmannii]|uniref:Uncharacterized protein n=1 Tax=Naganishia friedmannii TaxID=89922 RepID=A0ACC2VHY2_9TREE|nr:hypothetical protein QFC21_004321 [Naganishia friedmannii]
MAAHRYDVYDVDDPPESQVQDVDAVGTQANREFEAGTQPRERLTVEEKQKIRRELRQHQLIAEADNKDAERQKTEVISEHVEQLGKTFNKYSRVLATHVDTAYKIGKSAKSATNTFEEADFFEPLRELLGLDDRAIEDIDVDDEDDGHGPRRGGVLGDWAQIGWMAVKRSRRGPGAEFMNGMMAVEHRKRVINRKAKQKQALAPEVRPQEIRQGDMTRAVNPTIQNTDELDSLLGTLPHEVNYFKWVINPRSFGQTVENVFYTSFLINNGHAAIEIHEDGGGIPMIVGCNPPLQEDRVPKYNDDGTLKELAMSKRQLVMEWTMDLWREAIELFDIREGIIPHRVEEEAQQPGAAGWYG